FLDAIASYVKILSLPLDPHEPEPFADGRFARAARTHERVQHHAAGRRNETAQIGHQVRGLNRWMIVALAAVLFGCFGGVEIAALLSELVAIVENIGGETSLVRHGKLCGNLAVRCPYTAPRARPFNRVVVAFHPTPVNIDRTGPMRQDIGRNRTDQGLTGKDDRLPCRFERSAPSFPLLGFGGGGACDVHVPATMFPFTAC